MTNLERHLNILFSRLIGRENGYKYGYQLYRLCTGTQVTIVRQHGTQSLFKPKDFKIPTTGSFVAACECFETRGLILEYRSYNEDGSSTEHSSLLYSSSDIKLASDHVVAYLTKGIIPQPVETEEAYN